jgi:hypothetical protein
VEFALVFPLFLLLLLSVIEFAFVFSAMLGLAYATRDGALVAAEAGSTEGADCIILKTVEKDVGAPANKNQIQAVVIFRADKNGADTGSSNTWTRGGTFTCPDNSTVPYTPPRTFGYPEGPPTLGGVGGRCNFLNGCGGTRELDTIGVRVTYVHRWVTPLGTFGGGGFGGQGGSGFTLTQSNSMRMEPVL